ncbi:MAG: Ig-like domain-containing protein, partial [Actinomycetota bacterium]|nr:Ig-like domain-containing protein [Actinomycetota bacterium]
GFSFCDGGGGGGSSYGPAGATLNTGVQSGDGLVTITYNPIQAQTITFPQPTTPAAYGTSDTLTATASSGLTVTYTVDSSSTAGACTVSGSTVTYTGIGTCVIDANQAGDASFSAAPQVQRTVTVTKAATTTTLTVNPPSPAVNQATTLTATVHYSGNGAAPTGTVSFYDGATLLGTAPVQADGTATLVTSFGGGPHSITAVYSGDTNYVGSTSNPATPVNVFCDQIITGTHAALTVTSGTTCLINATITGGISVGRGASLSVQNSTVKGSISANHPATVRICGSTTGSIAVTGATGYVRIGDPNSNCAPNTINGGLTAANNTGGGTISGNTITGSTTIANNTPPFTVAGNHH